MTRLSDALERILQKDGRLLDDNQRAAVASDRTTVVKAGAGSGKTTVLSYRFLRLVLEGKADCDQILTLTFTRKAAAEMNERIYLRLLSYADKSQLSMFSDASISTMDSFFSQIVRSDCVRYGVTEDFTIASDTDISAAIGRISNDVFKRHRNDGALAVLGGAYNPEDLSDMLVSMGQSCFTMERSYDGRWWHEEYCRRLLTAFREELDRLGDISVILMDEYDDKSNRQALSEVLEAISTGNPTEVMRRLPLARLDGRLGSRASKTAERRAHTDQFRAVSALCCDMAGALVSSDAMRGVFLMLSEIQEGVKAYKQQNNTLSFLDVSRMALDILKTNKSIRKYYKNKFKYIMVDEFQDNNKLQKDILHLLAERLDREGNGVPGAEDLQPGKLFFVGDEKQSIYKFRGADVSVFKALSDEMAACGGTVLSLDRNYRSEPALIDEFNSVFTRVMAPSGEASEAPAGGLGREPGIAPEGEPGGKPGIGPEGGPGGKPGIEPKGEPGKGRDFEAHFERLDSRKATDGIRSRFTIAFKKTSEDFDEERDASSQQAEANYVGALIRRMVDTDDYLIPGDDGPRRPDYSDIAVLLRGLGKQHGFEKAFRIQGIPYCLQQTRALLQDAISNDIYNVLQLCLFPEDRLAYLSVLSSPLCHLEGADLEKALDAPPFTEAGLSGKARERYEAAGDRFNALKQLAAAGTVARMIDFIWNDWGYRFFVMSKKTSHSFAEHYDSLWTLAKAMDDNQCALSDFLAYIRPRMGENERLDDLDVMREQATGVQLMTIHKSKGLEFPIVIVADACTGRGGLKSLYYVDDDGLPFPNQMIFRDGLMDGASAESGEDAYPGNVFLQRSKDLEAQKEVAEIKRLLYVALTRAQTHLVVTGSVASRSRPDSLMELLIPDYLSRADGPIEGSMVDFVTMPDVPIQKTFISRSRISRDALAKADSVYLDERPLHRTLWLPDRIAVTKLYADSLSDGRFTGEHRLPAIPSDALISEKSLNDQFGTLCHSVLEKSVRLGAPIAMERVCEMAVGLDKLAALGRSELDMLVRDAVMFAHGFMESDYCRSMAGHRCETEVKFFLGQEIGGRMVAVEGIMDLLVTRDDSIDIIDYKTDRVMESSEHEGQLSLYRKALRRVTDLPVRCGLIYLRAPQRVVWLKDE